MLSERPQSGACPEAPAALQEECAATVGKYGVGSCGPRGFYGTIDVHLELEVPRADAYCRPKTCRKHMPPWRHATHAQKAKGCFCVWCDLQTVSCVPPISKEGMYAGPRPLLT